MSIEIKNVSFFYKNETAVNALQHIHTTISDGEFIGLIGKTGCGKTTLIQLIAGLLKPTEGSILFNGKNINDKSYDKTILHRKIGFVFQYPEIQLFSNTVEEDVSFTLRNRGLSKSEIQKKVADALTTAGFNYDEIRKQSPFSLSGGEKRRIALAGILAGEPSVLILDEPVAGLDPFARQRFMELLDTLNKQGTTIIMISHNMNIIGEYAQHLLVLDSGKLIMDNSVQKVFTDISLLKSMHLCVSEPRRITAKLQQCGISISQKITKYNELLNAISDYFSGNKK